MRMPLILLYMLFSLCLIFVELINCNFQTELFQIRITLNYYLRLPEPEEEPDDELDDPDDDDPDDDEPEEYEPPPEPEEPPL